MERTLGRALGGFKKELELGQVIKKKSVIQMIEVTNKGQRKMYDRWMKINEKSKIMKECQQVISTMESINKVIKSTNDIWMI